MVDILEELFGRYIDIKCEFIGEKIKRDEQSDMTKKVIEFFGGDVLEIK